MLGGTRRGHTRRRDDDGWPHVDVRESHALVRDEEWEGAEGAPAALVVDVLNARCLRWCHLVQITTHPPHCTSSLQVSLGSSRGTLQVRAARVAGVEIPNAKRVTTALTYVFGIGDTTAGKIMDSTGLEAGPFPLNSCTPRWCVRHPSQGCLSELTRHPVPGQRAEMSAAPGRRMQ